MLIIGITGGSGSGKTSLVNLLVNELKAFKLTIIPQDAYYFNQEHLNKEEKKNFNFDHPDAIDWDLLFSHLSLLKKGNTINRPIYEYSTCMRQKETISVYPSELIIIEGILFLTVQKIKDVIDYNIYIDVDEDERRKRILKRDKIERGKNEEEIEERLNKIVFPMHYKFIEPLKEKADIIINGRNYFKDELKSITSLIKNKLVC